MLSFDCSDLRSVCTKYPKHPIQVLHKRLGPTSRRLPKGNSSSTRVGRCSGPVHQGTCHSSVVEQHTAIDRLYFHSRPALERGIGQDPPPTGPRPSLWSPPPVTDPSVTSSHTDSPTAARLRPSTGQCSRGDRVVRSRRRRLARG